MYETYHDTGYEVQEAISDNRQLKQDDRQFRCYKFDNLSALFNVLVVRHVGAETYPVSFAEHHRNGSPMNRSTSLNDDHIEKAWYLFLFNNMTQSKLISRRYLMKLWDLMSQTFPSSKGLGTHSPVH